LWSNHEYWENDIYMNKLMAISRCDTITTLWFYSYSREIVFWLVVDWFCFWCLTPLSTIFYDMTLYRVHLVCAGFNSSCDRHLLQRKLEIHEHDGPRSVDESLFKWDVTLGVIYLSRIKQYGYLFHTFLSQSQDIRNILNHYFLIYNWNSHNIYIYRPIK